MGFYEKMPLIVQSARLPEQADKIFQFMQSIGDEAEDRDFIDATLMDKTSSNFFLPQNMNIDPIQNYFGEKIALFFTFNQHFCSKL